MAITRRQFVTRLGTLAAAVGLSQADISSLAQAWAHNTTAWAQAGAKPTVIWVHGAECTGCSTSLLSMFESLGARALAATGSTLTIQQALTGITGNADPGSHLVGSIAEGGSLTSTDHGHTTLLSAGLKDGTVADSLSTLTGTSAGKDGLDPAASVNIADVLIDFISLEYHETVMGMGGDLAYKWLEDRADNLATPFVLVVEGALQPRPTTDDGDGSSLDPRTSFPYCSVGTNDGFSKEHEPADIVKALANKATAVIAIGQCASYGGYPACVTPADRSAMTWVQDGGKQTTAMGVYDFLKTHYVHVDDSKKVINVPGCPTNPWWFVLTTVLWMYDVVNGPLKVGGAVNGPLGIVRSDLKINAAAVDGGLRLKAVYGTSVHGPGCPRHKDYTAGNFAQQPGDPGCLLELGCKGTTTNSLCSVRGWNAQNATNPAKWDAGVGNITKSYLKRTGGFCPAAGHPCMGCTEKGYPDVNLPFVKIY